MSDIKQMIKEWNDPYGARTVPDAEELIDALITERHVQIGREKAADAEIQRLRDLLDRAYLENRKYGHIGLVTCGHIEAELQEQDK